MRRLIFNTPEANLIFQAALLSEKSALTLEKKFDKKDISQETYIARRQKLIDIAKEFLEEIKSESNNIQKKSTHILNNKGTKYE